MLGELLDDLLTSPSTGPCITATRHFAPRPPVLVPFPPSLDPRIADALRARGIRELYSHQAQWWELIEKGHHVVVVTPTASGKTLCYNLPALQSLLHQPDARVLYLFPTKALAQDQLAELEALAKSLPEMRMFTDRKSTRLNSSHLVISYAVFCLKKKKQETMYNYSDLHHQTH